MLKKYSSENPAQRVRLTWRFAWSHPAHVLATFFGAGAMRPAPGTWGTLAGILVFALLTPWVSTLGWVVLAALFTVAGAWAADVTAEHLGVEDHGGVVIDEVVAVWLTAAFLPAGLGWWAAAFTAFRVFDIIKLWPVSFLDEKLKNGWGVMIDDLFAALYAWGTIRIVAELAGLWS